MKPGIAYNLLLALALAVCGAVVFYNLALRESFPVLIQYSLPASFPEAAGSAPEEEITQGDGSPHIFLVEPEEEWVEWEEPDWWQENEDVLLSVDFPLELNGATEQELKFIPGVGDVTSQRIVQYRDVLGGYTSLEQLMEIKGIGDGTYAKISPYLYLDGEWAAEQPPADGETAAAGTEDRAHEQEE